MRKIKAIVLIMILAILCTLTINAAQIKPEDYETNFYGSHEEAFKFGGNIAGTIQIIGTIVSAGTLIIIGIRYIVASAEEKAEYKERMVPYVIGVVMLFGATNIVGIMAEISGNIGKKSDEKIEISVNGTTIATVGELEHLVLPTYTDKLFCPFCRKWTNKINKRDDNGWLTFKCGQCNYEFDDVSEFKFVDGEVKQGNVHFENAICCAGCGVFYIPLDEESTCYNCSWNLDLTIESKKHVEGFSDTPFYYSECSSCGGYTRSLLHPVANMNFGYCVHCKGVHKGTINYDQIFPYVECEIDEEGNYIFNWDKYLQMFGAMPSFEDCVKPRYVELRKKYFEAEGILEYNDPED